MGEHAVPFQVRDGNQIIPLNFETLEDFQKQF